MTRFLRNTKVREDLVDAIRNYIGAEGEPEDVMCDDVAAVIAVCDIMARDHRSFFNLPPQTEVGSFVIDDDENARSDKIVSAVLGRRE